MVDPRMKKRRPASPPGQSRGARTRSVDPASLSGALEMRTGKARKERVGKLYQLGHSNNAMYDSS